MRVRHALVALTLLVAAPALAQRGPQLGVTLTTSSPQGATVIARRMLSDGKTREMLLSGFNVVMHFRLELWRVGGFFDNLDTTATWDVLVRYEAYSRTYQVVRRSVRETEASKGVASADSAEAVLELPLPVQLAPPKRGATYYYNVLVDVETLSVSDLDELQRWLRGDLQPAVRGKTDPVSALRRGLGTLLSRLLGGERRHYEARSVTFRG